MPSLFYSYFHGLIAAAGLIMAIGAQNAFVLAQGLRREHHISVALICMGCDAVLMNTAIAAAIAALGADVHLVSGPVNVADPAGVGTVHVETARQMRDAVMDLLPADAAIFVAAVADWRTADSAGEKIKKVPGGGPPAATGSPPL